MTLFLLFIIHFFSEGPVVITSGSFQGLAQGNGEIIIPPVYDAIGWSDGTVSIHKEVIGFKQNTAWGLISVKNKRLSNPSFVELKPFEDEYILAAVKGKFSNLPFYGLLDNRGNTKVRFAYFQLKPISETHILASKYDRGKVQYGVINYDGEQIIPLIFDDITLESNIFVASKSNKIKLFNDSGVDLTQSFVDNILISDAGYIIESAGSYGLLSSEGNSVHDISYKSIQNQVAYSFNRWEVSCISQPCETISVGADSLTINDRLQLVAHLNNTQHLLGGDSAIHFGKNYEILNIQRGYMLMKNKSNGTYMLTKTNGEKVLKDYDFVSIDSQYYYGLKDSKWIIIDLFGRQITSQKYEEIGSSHNYNIPVKKNQYWGWIDFDGNKIINHKYDLVKAGVTSEQFIAKYIDSWGIINFTDKPIIMERYDSIVVAANIYLAYKGASTHLIDSFGRFILKSGDKITLENGLLLTTDNANKLGLVTTNGKIIEPEYDEISRLGDFVLLRKDGFVAVLSMDEEVIGLEVQLEEVFGFDGEYFHVLLDGKHGFVDLNGNLRIANRYDGALGFKNNIAPIKIGDKWGFIDRSENLVIQPLYKEVSDFQDGLAIVKEGRFFGLIDLDGKYAVSAQWDRIERLQTGNYLIFKDEKVGLVNSNGQILLRANYEFLEDTVAGLVIAKKGKLKGVIDYAGYTKTPFDYEEINILGDYLLLLKRVEYAPSQP